MHKRHPLAFYNIMKLTVLQISMMAQTLKLKFYDGLKLLRVR